MGTGPWPQPPTEAEQLQALMAAANGESYTSSSFSSSLSIHFVSIHKLNEGAWEGMVYLGSCLVGGHLARLTH